MNGSTLTGSGRKRKFTPDYEDENEQGGGGGGLAARFAAAVEVAPLAAAVPAPGALIGASAASDDALASPAAEDTAAPPTPPTAAPTDDDLFDESEALALQFMREEEEAHMERMMQLQRASLQRAMSMEHDDGFEGDAMDPDLAFALRLQREEGEAVHGAGEEGEYIEGEGEGEDIDPDAMTYDELLELGAQMGDVAQERWQQRAAGVIKEIPIVVWEAANAKALNERCGAGTGAMCVVCQCDYEENDTLKILRCGHCFHGDCVDRWLKDNKQCCMCKASVASPPPAK